MIAVVHAFSRANSGDSLLVDLTLARLARAGVDPARCTVFAMEPHTFPDLPSVVGVPGEPSGRPTLAAARAASLLARSSLPVGHRTGAHPVLRALSGAEAIVAVGGGYLRAGTAVNSAGVALNHLPTLLAAGASDAPSLYLPQSIGPLRGPVGAWLRRALARVDVVCARDDRTVAELGGLPNVRRVPDLAVLELADALPEGDDAPLDGPVVLVGRAVDGPRAEPAAAALRTLGDDLGATWAVQADVGGARSDARFYERIGVGPAPALQEVLATQPRGVVVSVRLHGALEALLAGWPAIHLSYQRKGWAAFGDLGLAEHVHSAFDVPVERITEQVRSVQADPGRYWERVRGQQPLLTAASGALDELVRATVSVPRPPTRTL